MFKSSEAEALSSGFFTKHLEFKESYEYLDSDWHLIEFYVKTDWWLMRSAYKKQNLTIYLDTKSINWELHLSGSLKDGGGFVGIMKIARMGWISPYGAFPSAISRAVMPKLLSWVIKFD